MNIFLKQYQHLLVINIDVNLCCRLMIAHLGLQAALLGLIWWLVKVMFATTWTKTGLIVPITYLFFDQL